MVDSKLRAVLFDMDGTLVNTLPDIAAAINEALAEMRLQPLAAERIGDFIGKGPRALASRVLDEQPSLDVGERHALVDTLIAGYVKHYEPRIGTAAMVYPGVADALEALRRQGLKLAVVTNALQHLAERVLTRFDLIDHFGLVLGGDRVARGKPDATPLLDACRILAVSPDVTLMVGDSENDVLAARAARCPVVVVPYGYNAGQPASSLGCDIVDNFTLLPAWIAGFPETASISA